MSDDRFLEMAAADSPLACALSSSANPANQIANTVSHPVQVGLSFCALGKSSDHDVSKLRRAACKPAS
jgi:hypothetical protein